VPDQRSGYPFLEFVFSLWDEDQRMTPWHMALYLALFRQWSRYKFSDSILVSRSQLMDHAKINSRTTFARLMLDLQNWAYIEEYHPQHNPKLQSCIKLNAFREVFFMSHPEATVPRNSDFSNPCIDPYTADTCPPNGHLTGHLSEHLSEHVNDTCPPNGHLNGTCSKNGHLSGHLSEHVDDTCPPNGHLDGTCPPNGHLTGHLSGHLSEHVDDTCPPNGHLSEHLNDTCPKNGHLNEDLCDTCPKIGHLSELLNEPTDDKSPQNEHLTDLLEKKLNEVESIHFKVDQEEELDLKKSKKFIYSSTSTSINNKSISKSTSTSTKEKKIKNSENENQRKTPESENQESLWPQNSFFQPPALEQVILGFRQAGGDEDQARKFYKYYTDKNWCLSGGAKMTHLDKAIFGWIRRNAEYKKNSYQNHSKPTHHGPYHDPLNGKKDYSEPL
jgi:hypothetical protein